ncbi:MAG: prepilin-type N-terminal cleavage/methylation domain-containing protein [Cyanobacteria bacterium J06632_22]
MRIAKLMRPLFKGKSDSGLTLIECLVAVAVIAATVGITTPVVILSVATRVQSQRAEQALQLAQAEIDRLRVQTERGGSYTIDVASTALATDVTQFEANVPAPVNGIDNAQASTSVNYARLASVSGNEYAIQSFRTVGSTTATGKPISFDMGVRVYRADVIRNTPAGDLKTEGAALNMTSGEELERPLAVIYTTIVQGDREDSLCNYYNTINPAASAPSNC